MKKIIGIIISYLFIFYFLVCFANYWKGTEALCTTASLVFEEPYRFFTASFETKLQWFEGISEEGKREVFKQERYIYNGIFGQFQSLLKFNSKWSLYAFFQLLLPFLIIYLTFYSKWSIITKSNDGVERIEANKILWIYFIVCLFYLFAISKC